MPRRILFVCSGNQCRSPVAAKMFEKMLKREGFSDVEVLSAGTVTSGGQPAGQMTRDLLSPLGIDLSNHCSMPLSVELIRECDLILVMEDMHRIGVMGLCPEVLDKIKLLSSYSPHARPGEGISDPTGMPPVAYRTCFAQIMEALEGLIKALKNGG